MNPQTPLPSGSGGAGGTSARPGDVQPPPAPLPSPPPDPVTAAGARPLRTTLFAALDHAVNAILLSAFALAGTIAVDVPVRIVGVALAFNMLFLGLIAGGATRRLRDPSLTALQVFAACGINLLVLWLAPQIAYMPLVNLFVLLSWGSLYFSQRTFFIAWAALTIVLGIALHAVGARVDIADETGIERWLFWVILALALGRFLAINAEVSRLRAGLQARNAELARMAGKLADLASRDDLTGLWNRREFMRLLRDQRKRAERQGSGFCVALLDADHFKQVNDRLGHQTGDAVLQELAHLFEASRRTTDSLARYGGEEFIILLDGDAAAATHALERIRRSVELHDWSRIAATLRVTISIGMAAWRPDEDVERVIGRADAALYRAKEEGRNRLCLEA